MSGFQVGVAALSGPTQRLKQISLDLTTAGSGAATAAGSGGAAAGDPAVVSAAAVFEAGVRTVLGALGDDAGLLGDKVQRAGITYETTDRTAMPTAPGGGSSTSGGTQPSPWTSQPTDQPGSQPGSQPADQPSGSTPGGQPGTQPGSQPADQPSGSQPGSQPVSQSADQPSGSPPGSQPAAPPAAPPADRPVAPPTSVQVASGDSLWSIAARTLGPGASDSAVAAEYQRWYAANRDLIGSDPNLIHSGITLRAPEGTP